MNVDFQLSLIKAPGKPTEQNRFIPASTWDSKQVKNPIDVGYGWPDVNGNVWVPTGQVDLGSAHWNVVFPNGCMTTIYP